MITVEQAFERIVTAANPLTTERRPIEDCSGYVLAAPLASRRSQPGADLSAMDGYAVIHDDLTGDHATLHVIDESAAGNPSNKKLDNGQAIRIFTGAAVPDGATQVVLQEDCTLDGDKVVTSEQPCAGNHIRPLGTDFGDGQIVLEAGTFLTPKSLGLAAAAGHDHLMVHRAPKIALLSTGDELVAPGKSAFKPFETVNSVIPQLSALFRDAGAQVIHTGHAGDDLEHIKNALLKTQGADILITIGGASVGDKDLIQEALGAHGMKLDFWKLLMRPGKPLVHGRIDQTTVLGLPGNPVSAFVCSLLFARPLIDQLMGRPAPFPSGVPLPLASSLAPNGPRQHYMRARLVGQPGSRMVDPAVSQDSSLQSVLAQSDGLIIREPHADAAEPGTLVHFLPF